MFDDARAASRQARSLRRVGHRPFPLPSSRWTLGQTWEHYFWAHWRVPVEEMRAAVPDELEIEECDGSAWLGMVVLPRARAAAARRAAAAGHLELPPAQHPHVRARAGRAAGRLVLHDRRVEPARRARRARGVYHVPAFHARMTLELADDWTRGGVRADGRGRDASSPGATAPPARRFHAEPGSLEWFLTERYRLFAHDARAEMHHDQWLLRPAEAEIELTSISPFALSGEPLCHLSLRQDALIWPPEPVR